MEQTQATHLVLFDGVCGLCSGFVQFVIAHDRRGAFAFASLQSAAGRAMVARWGRNPDDLASFYVVADFRTADARFLAKGAAALFVADQCGWPWRAASVARLLPNAILDRGYDCVARNRYRIFGRREACVVPSAALRHRFLE
jgi:predicted DCC family thiol-disulfide oxidoreductase YuxK